MQNVVKSTLKRGKKGFKSSIYFKLGKWGKKEKKENYIENGKSLEALASLAQFGICVKNGVTFGRWSNVQLKLELGRATAR